MTSLAELRAPRTSGATLFWPPRSQWGALARANRAKLTAAVADIGPLAFAEFRRLARQQFPAVDPYGLWIVTGHQPEPFHPGVWLKNFAVAGLARQVGGAGFHIRTDNDAVQRTALPIPGGTAAKPFLESVPFANLMGTPPWEEAAVADESLYAEFGAHVTELLTASGDPTPFPKFWAAAGKRDPTAALLADRFSAGRRAVEFDMGVWNHESALGQLCRGPAFFAFAAAVLADAQRFAQTHNIALADYRREHRLRGKHHPVPELTIALPWVEIPFWCWTTDEPVRARPMVRRDGDELTLRFGAREFRLRCGTPRQLADALADRCADFKLRPRALMTTGFLRLALADLFVHGLGGGKYDALTDRLLAEFFGLDAPAYAIATGTLRLDETPAIDVRPLTRTVRDHDWNPQRYIDDALIERPRLAELVERKERLLARAVDRDERRAAFAEVRAATLALRPFAEPSKQRAEAALAAAKANNDRLALRSSRDLPFFTYPTARLETLLLPLL